MTGDIMRRDAAQSIIELCQLGLDPATLRAHVLPRLRRAVPADGLWWATSDPATLLFTGTYQEQIPERTKPYFLENEFIADDVNKWVDVARDPDGVRTLHQATRGVMSQSARYKEIFHPLGFGDELRAVFRVQGACWGFLCLHREAPRSFSSEDALFLKSIASHVALGLRAGLVIGALDAADVTRAPGVVLLSPELAVTGWTPAAELWLEELGVCGRTGRLVADGTARRGGAPPDPDDPGLTGHTPSRAHPRRAVGRPSRITHADCRRRCDRGHHRPCVRGGGGPDHHARIWVIGARANNHGARVPGDVDLGDSRCRGDFRQHRAGPPQVCV
jgi:hypothetical protein